ncbi:LysR family transcriptional regulator [Jiella sp. MQZ9-1]|uniref:LysR family transcriptional regulator n=1 Tax=Jiella flava TaxID=2816857 RepID=A0A939FYX8_9HYPH|nr:LysR family transcriptional regulator [Jiella flava]MBO0662563.1 LysR family transcriptional regulator [Jiella flava]MCD2472934.1 LysR family transcriptional regulator [Jiella flava]
MRARQLEVFCAVMRTGTVTEAAATLNTSQPALSQILLHAEDELGFRLFERVKGRLVPTPAAEELYPEAERVFAELDALRRRTEDMRKGRVGLVRLGSSAPPAMSLIPGAMRRFRADRPDVTVRSMIAPVEVLGPMLLAGDVEIAVAMDDTPRPGLNCETVGRSGLVCIMPEGHRLTRCATVDLQALQDWPLISYRPSSRPGRDLSRMAAAAGRSYRPDIEIDVSLSAVTFVQENLGVALVDGLLPWRQFKGIQARPFASDFDLPVALLTRADRALSPASDRLRTHLRDVCAALLGSAP